MPNFLPQSVYDDLAIRNPWRNADSGSFVAGSVAQTMSRTTAVANLTALLSGREDLQLIWLNQGQRIASITHYSATTAGATLTAQWFSLRNASRQLLAVTVDDTNVAWAADTAKTLALAVPYTVRASGYYYVGRMIAATTVPTLRGRTGIAALNAIAPINGGTTTDTGLTTPATAPATSSVITATVNDVLVTLS